MWVIEKKGRLVSVVPQVRSVSVADRLENIDPTRDRQPGASPVGAVARLLGRTSLLYAVEILIVLVVLALTTHNLQNWDSSQRVRGSEYSYLINSGAIAANVYRATGAIPLWNPFMGNGEPLIESPFSFVLNPLMSVPLYLEGPIQGGKLAVLLHIALLAVGGWMLGWILDLKTPGRVLLGFLFGCCGSVVGAIGMGFYQMALSQAYVPWVFAGLVGILYHRKGRLSIALLAVSSTLMVFAGTFWYVLPTALSCLVLIAAHAVRRDSATRRLRLDWPMLQQVALAGVFVVGLSAIRLLPQAVHWNYVDHPMETLNTPSFPFLDLFHLYFAPVPLQPFDNTALYFHYILPVEFAVVLIVGRLIVGALGAQVEGRWRLIIPALVLVVIYTAWGQGGAFTNWLYDAFPLLREWRFVSRIMAASTPLIAIVAAIWFDNVTVALWQYIGQAGKLRPRFGWIPRPLLSTLAAAGLIVLFGVGVFAVSSIDHSWDTQSGTEPATSVDGTAINYLRMTHPVEFLSVLTSSFYDYLPYYVTLVRAGFGNPDYRSLSIEPTIGKREAMKFNLPYALGGGSDQFPDYLRQVGYQLMPENSRLFTFDMMWEDPAAPPYAFSVPVASLDDRDKPLTIADVQPAMSFIHHINSIDVTVGGNTDGMALVAQEVAYPGWQVTIDGVPTALESVGGLIGVRLPVLPPGAAPLHVVFSYRPIWLFVGGAITLIAVLMFVVFALRLDEVARGRRVAVAHAGRTLPTLPNLTARRPSVPAVAMVSQPSFSSAVPAAKPVEMPSTPIPFDSPPSSYTVPTVGAPQTSPARRERWFVVGAIVVVAGMVGFLLGARNRS